MLNSTYGGCIYLASNRVNGSIYIGKSLMGMRHRMKTHLSAVRNGYKQPFICALRKHGADSFQWHELFLSDDHDTLMAAEIELIAAFKASGARMYNATAGGDGASRKRSAAEIERMKLRRLSEDTKALLRASWTPERRAAQAAKMASRVVTDESRAAMSAGCKGKPKSAEHIAKSVASRRGQIAPKWTPERRAKMEAAWAQGNRSASEETKRKISETKRARTTEATRAHCREAGKLGAAKRWQG